MLSNEELYRRLAERRRVLIAPESLTVVLESTSIAHRWDAIIRTASTDNHLFFFLSVDQAHIVPKEAFADVNEFQLFVEKAKLYHASGLARIDA